MWAHVFLTNNGDCNNDDNNDKTIAMMNWMEWSVAMSGVRCKLVFFLLFCFLF